MSTEPQPVDNTADIIDSRDVIARISYLWGLQEDQENDPAGDYFGEEERGELTTLLELAKEGELLSDWVHGEALIRDSYFEDYARELAEDIGAIDREAAWPLGYIDWPRAAEALLMDYTDLDFDGVTYWARS